MVGIDISDRSIKLVEIEGREDPVLRTMCWSPLEVSLMRRGVVQDIPAVTQAVRDAMGKYRPVAVAGTDVVASIPEVQSFVRVLDLPEMKEHEISEAVRWAVKRHIPFDLESVYLDWEPVGKDKGSASRQVLVGAAQRDVVDPLLSALDNIGLNVVALELETQAILRCLLPMDQGEASEISGVLAIDLGATLTNIVFFDKGAIRFTTSIQWGGDDLTQRLAHELSISPAEAVEEKAKIGLEVSDQKNKDVSSVLRAAVIDLGNRVARIVQEMTVQLSAESRVKMILISGGGASLGGIVDIFGSIFSGIPVQLGNPWTNLNREEQRRRVDLSTEDAMHFTTAIGLALRPNDYI